MAIPPPETLLGYITTGQYCYSEGKNYGIGCCSATGLARIMELETRQQTQKNLNDTASMSPPTKVPKMMVLVRSIRSRVSRLAKLAILS